MHRAWRRWTAAGVVAAGVVGGAAMALTRPQESPAESSDEARRQQPAVMLAWSGPTDVRVGRPHPYTLTVTNTSPQAVQKVVVQVRVPDGVTPADIDPPARAVGGVLMWEVGTLAPRHGKEIKLNLTSATRGGQTADAWVTFTGSASITTTAKEPKLAVALTVPESVAIGDSFQVRYDVSNPGDIAAEKVTVSVAEPTGLIPDGEPAAGVELNDVAPAATRTVTRSRAGKVPGEYTYRVTASSPDGQHATAIATVKVKAPKLVATITGPSEVGLNKPAAYTVKVSNVGDLAAEQVSVRGLLGAGIAGPATVVLTTHPTQTVDPCAATFDEIKPGESREFTITGTAARPGGVLSTVTATEKRGSTASAECSTVVRGVPGIRMEVVDVNDPVEKGKETVYEVRVTNTGTETDHNVRVVCTLPPQLAYREGTGPVGHTAAGPNVAFEPIRELGPKAEVVLRVRATAVGVGNTRFKASITSDHLTDPVMKEESTTVYGE